MEEPEPWVPRLNPDALRIKEGLVFVFVLFSLFGTESLHVYTGTSCVDQHRSRRPYLDQTLRKGLNRDYPSMCLSNSRFVLDMVAHSFNPGI